MIWKKHARIYFHQIHPISCAHYVRAQAAAAPFASFLCIKSVHFLQPFILFMHKEKNIQIDLFWHTQPSAERVKSIQPRSLCRLTCLHACTRVHKHTHSHTHRSTWTLLFGSVLFAVSFYMLSLLCAAAAAALELYLVSSKSEHSVRYGNEEAHCCVCVAAGNIKLVLSVSWS